MDPIWWFFCKIPDIMISGYGKSDVDKNVLVVKLSVEEKVKFWSISYILIFFYRVW